jgi:hypothetical protein
MQRVRRSRMSANEKTAIWDRWARGESLSEIGRAINRIPAEIFMSFGREVGPRRHLAGARLAR